MLEASFKEFSTSQLYSLSEGILNADRIWKISGNRPFILVHLISGLARRGSINEKQKVALESFNEFSFTIFAVLSLDSSSKIRISITTEFEDIKSSSILPIFFPSFLAGISIDIFLSVLNSIDLTVEASYDIIEHKSILLSIHNSTCQIIN